MPARRILALVAVATLLLAAAVTGASASHGAPAAPGPGHSSTAPAVAARDTALFAGGCFWCMETQFEGRPGVVDAISGYSGGHTVDPTYDEVNTHTTGHLETVEVVFDPRRIRYEQLLDIFWHSIDPTQADGQFCDKGNSYYSAIFWRNDAQRRAAERTKRAIEASGVLPGPVVTQIRRAGPFYRAEEYHQDFYRKDPARYRSYREGCGRDRRLRELWGDRAAKPSVH
jgi:peptide-methionine (S)-S-oxide reductase